MKAPHPRTKTHKKKVCIVTPDIVGIVRNGGIGTYCYWLSRLLSENGCEVTLLYTGDYEENQLPFARNFYQELGIGFEALDYPQYPRGHSSLAAVDRSPLVYERTKNRDYDVIHFQDYGAWGFTSLSAKKTGLSFQNTLLTVTLHSPLLWLLEGSKKWPDHPGDDAKLIFCERYCIENADVLISPSQYMLRWCTEKGWSLARHHVVLPYPYETKVSAAPPSSLGFSRTHIAFVGRLETRKGLMLFCEALDLVLASDSSDPIRRISFCGKPDFVAFQREARDYLKSYQQKWEAKGIRVDLLPDLDIFEVSRFLNDTRAIAFMPSLQDNLPYTVLECAVQGLPLLASRVGGIPELIGEAALFEPTRASLADAIKTRCERIRELNPLYSPEKANNAWLSFINQNWPEKTSPPAEEVSQEEPRVSVCVAYYNYGKYLPLLLKSLADSTYKNFEVIVVNDGSTDAFSREVFEKEAAKYVSQGWRFFSQANSGIGATRNFAAGQAQGKYLVFCDADNVVVPEMISTFVGGILHSRADCVTCHLSAFSGEGLLLPGNPSPVFTGQFPGPSLVAGCLENVFGDANFCIRRDVFLSLGGFSTDRELSWEDFEFLAKLSLLGFRLEVIPKVLFYYRCTPEGISRVTSRWENHRRVLRSYAQFAPRSVLTEILTSLVVPFSAAYSHYEKVSVERENALKQKDDHIHALLREREDAIAEFLENARQLKDKDFQIRDLVRQIDGLRRRQQTLLVQLAFKLQNAANRFPKARDFLRQLIFRRCGAIHAPLVPPPDAVT